MSSTTILEQKQGSLTVILSLNNKTVVRTQNGETPEVTIQRAAQQIGLDDFDLGDQQILAVPADGSPARVVPADKPLEEDVAALSVDRRRRNG